MPVPDSSVLWLHQQDLLTNELTSARDSPNTPVLGAAIERALVRYEAYYRARAESIHADPVRFFCAPGASPLERATQWVAGWRPSVFIHLLYSESGIRLQDQFDDLLDGVHSGDLGDLSPWQLGKVDEVQRRTIREEEEITQEMGELQVGLGEGDWDLEEKVGILERIIKKADDLRMRTLKDIVDFLEPVQVVDLLVAAADFEIGMRCLGMDRSITG
ncbi:putative transcription factor TGA like domain-containing protein [Dioscorea sansibarensis]